MGSMLIVYGLIVGTLVLLYLLVIRLLMRLSRRKEQRRMEEAQEALADGTLHRPVARSEDGRPGSTAPPLSAKPGPTE